MVRQADDRLPRVLPVPTALWAYGFFRAVAFGLPVLSSHAGRIGLGVAVVLVLFVGVVLRATWAWIALALLDALSLTTTVVLSDIPDDVPWGVVVSTVLALVVLLTPSVQRHVGWPRNGHVRD